jgi:hypothetical protein
MKTMAIGMRKMNSGASKTELGGLDVLIADWAARYLGR